MELPLWIFYYGTASGILPEGLLQKGELGARVLELRTVWYQIVTRCGTFRLRCVTLCYDGLRFMLRGATLCVAFCYVVLHCGTV